MDTSFDEAIAADEWAANATVVALPAAHGDVSVNFCKTPTCANFGIAEALATIAWSKDLDARYKVTGSHQYPHLSCRSTTGA